MAVKMLRLGTSLILAATLASCASTSDNAEGRCAMGQNEIYSRLDTRSLINSLVTDLCSISAASFSDDLREFPVLVPDALNVQSLQPESLGLAFGELLRSSVSNACRVKIQQVDLSKDLQLNQRGIVALTREATRARTKEFNSQFAIIVTFNQQPTKLTLVARNVDLSSATIIAVSTKEASWSCKSGSDGAQRFNSRVD